MVGGHHGAPGGGVEEAEAVPQLVCHRLQQARALVWRVVHHGAGLMVLAGLPGRNTRELTNKNTRVLKKHMCV